MKIHLDKQTIPKAANRLSVIKGMELYKFYGYDQNDDILEAPSQDVSLEEADSISRVGVVVEAFEYWIEVPNANLADNLPDGVSYRNYFDTQEPPVEQTRTWADLSELATNFAGTATMRYWQPSNNSIFIHEDVYLITEAGFEVFSKSALLKKLNKDYDDPGDPEYTEIETIDYIDKNWALNGYFDMVDAYLIMKDIYEAKGATDNDRWAASDDIEKEILVRWNQVGLSKALDIVNPSLSEGQQAIIIGKKYREFNINMLIALERRFTDWYQYLNMILSNTGKTKFSTDWSWIYKDDYSHRYLRQYELNVVNALIDFHDNVLSNYSDGDFVGTISASAITNNLGKVLKNNTYTI